MEDVMKKVQLAILLMFIQLNAIASPTLELELFATMLTGGNKNHHLKLKSLPKNIENLNFPQQWQVIGHQTKDQQYSVSYFLSNNTYQSSQNQLKQFLSDSGFKQIENEDPYPQGGFVEKGYRDNIPPATLYCHNKLGFVDSFVTAMSNGNLIFFNNNPFSEHIKNCLGQQMPSPFFPGPLGAGDKPLKLPTLEVEDKPIKQAEYMTPYGDVMYTGTRWLSFIKIDSTKPTKTLLIEMKKQLEQQGWIADSQWHNKNTAGGIWRQNKADQHLFGELYIVKLSDNVVEMTIAAREQR